MSLYAVYVDDAPHTGAYNTKEAADAQLASIQAMFPGKNVRVQEHGTGAAPTNEAAGSTGVTLGNPTGNEPGVVTEPSQGMKAGPGGVVLTGGPSPTGVQGPVPSAVENIPGTVAAPSDAAAQAGKESTTRSATIAPKKGA